MDHEEERARPFYHSHELLLVEHDAAVQVQAQTRLDLIHKQGCQHQVPV